MCRRDLSREAYLSPGRSPKIEDGVRARALDGTPFTDRGFQNIPALGHLVSWLDEFMAAA